MASTTKMCECENVCHFDSNPRVTPHGHEAHEYGHECPTDDIKAVRTAFGTFHVCSTCKADCFALYIEDSHDAR